MKFRLLFIGLLSWKICLCQLNLVDTNKYSITVNKLFGSNTNYGWFSNYLNNEKNYFEFLEYNDQTQFFYFRINNNYDTLRRKLLTFQNPIESFISTSNSFFVITSYKTTMGDPSKAFLSKYDSNWNKLWTKTIINNNIPDDNFVMTLNAKNELLIFSKQYLQNSANAFKVFEKRDLNGKLLQKQKIELPKWTEWIPNNIVRTLDSNLLLTSVLFNVDKQKSVLELQKITQDCKMIWTRNFDDFEAEQTLIQKNGNIVLYGKTYDNDKQSNTYLHKKLKIILVDKDGKKLFQKIIEDNNELEPGSVSETQYGNLIFSSSINPSYCSLNKSYVFELDMLGQIVYAKVIDAVSTSKNDILLPTKDKIILSNTQYYPTWGYSHNCCFNFLSLTKQQ